MLTEIKLFYFNVYFMYYNVPQFNFHSDYRWINIKIIIMNLKFSVVMKFHMLQNVYNVIASGHWYHMCSFLFSSFSLRNSAHIHAHRHTYKKRQKRTDTRMFIQPYTHTYPSPSHILFVYDRYFFHTSVWICRYTVSVIQVLTLL